MDLDERRARVTAAVDAMTEHRDLLALVVRLGIGKPWRLAWPTSTAAWTASAGTSARSTTARVGPSERGPLPGPVSNIASWNYPMSVQVHAELVQAARGQRSRGQDPEPGWLPHPHARACAHAAGRTTGDAALGHGRYLGEALIRSEGIGALAFVGGRANGRKAAVSLADTGRRHMLEQEGLNTWGIWDFSQWHLLAQHLRKGFEYAKQRCTAYPRYVVQRRLFPDFLESYLPVVKSCASAILWR